jgi:hypothetical protein
MLVEGLMRRRVSSDALAAGIALGAYVVALVHVLRLFFTLQANAVRTWFAVAVVVAIVWNGLQWLVRTRSREID